MRSTTAVVWCFLALIPGAGCSDDPAAPVEVSDPFESVTPEDVGWSSEKLLEVDTLVASSGYAAVLAAHDGKVFYTWGDVGADYRIHSIRKPLLGALVGMSVADGVIDLDVTLEDLGIDDIPPVLTNEEKQATVRHLIMSRSGVYHEAAAETAEMAASRPDRGSHPPGTFFYYNNWDFNTAGAVYEQQTGAGIFEAFAARVADRIGMVDFRADQCYYAYEPEKSMYPAYHFRMSARDLARFGVLYQKNGVWNGRRLLPESWIEESTTAYSVADAASGAAYGYLWSVAPEGSPIAGMIGYPFFFHSGVGVQVVVVIPDLKLVIVELMDTDGAWTDPGEIGMLIGLEIVNARSSG